MAKLGCAWYFNDSSDLNILLINSRRPAGINGFSNDKSQKNRKRTQNNSHIKTQSSQVLAIQVKCFQEIMQVGFLAYRVDDIPWFRHFPWYLLLISNYYYYGECFFDYFGPPLNRIEALQLLIRSHRFISYCLYLIGLISFVLSLVKKYNTRQFRLFAWAHVAILITVVQSYLVMRNTLDGEP